MEKVKIGFSRIYNAGACTQEGEADIGIQFQFGRFNIYFHAGVGLKHPVFMLKIGPPVPKDTTTAPKPSKAKGQQLPKEADFPADYYVEIIVQEWLEVDDALAANFRAGDPSAQNALLKLLNQRKEEYLTAVDFAAGYLGLKVNKLLFIRPIHEQYYIYRDAQSMTFSIDINVNVTGTFNFDQSGHWMSGLKNSQSSASGKWEKSARPLAWLLRAWAEEDKVFRCFSLITALEQVIPGPPMAHTQPWNEAKTKVLSLLKVHANPTEVDALVDWIELLRQPAPVLSRFTHWAKNTGLVSREKDIATFKKFNKIRNQLFHTGNPAIDYQVNSVLKDIDELEDLAERYVSLALFGDTEVYKHHLR